MTSACPAGLDRCAKIEVNGKLFSSSEVFNELNKMNISIGLSIKQGLSWCIAAIDALYFSLLLKLRLYNHVLQVYH